MIQEGEHGRHRIWDMQGRLETRRRMVEKPLEHRRFRAACNCFAALRVGRLTRVSQVVVDVSGMR